MFSFFFYIYSELTISLPLPHPTIKKHKKCVGGLRCGGGGSHLFSRWTLPRACTDVPLLKKGGKMNHPRAARSRPNRLVYRGSWSISIKGDDMLNGSRNIPCHLSQCTFDELSILSRFNLLSLCLLTLVQWLFRFEQTGTMWRLMPCTRLWSASFACILTLMPCYAQL